jgi:hypothetical protein
MRCRGSHIFQTIDSQMALRLSALRSGRPVSPGRFLVLIPVRDWVDPRAVVRLEWLDKLKNPVTSSGFKPATFRLVAWCLNQLRYHVPPFIYYINTYLWKLLFIKIVLLHVPPLLGNVLVNKFPRRQILGKQSVASSRNNKGSCVFRVRGDVTTVDSDRVTCVRANRLAG